MLADMGHRAFACGDADGAMRLAAEHGPIDVLVVDLGLPGVSGDVLAARLLTVNDGLAVVIASGRSGLPAGADEAVARRAVILGKPYDDAGLARAIAEAVARAEAPETVSSVGASSAAPAPRE
jgi:FixJ family two-component response regulator